MAVFSRKSRMIMFYISLVLVAVGAGLHITHLSFTPYLVILGALGITLFFMLRTKYTRTPRGKRLDYMGMLGGLFYIVTGGFMIDQNNIWIILFTIGTVFLVYNLFVAKD